MFAYEICYQLPGENDTREWRVSADNAEAAVAALREHCPDAVVVYVRPVVAYDSD